jgi:hypothetical protein
MLPHSTPCSWSYTHMMDIMMKTNEIEGSKCYNFFSLSCKWHRRDKKTNGIEGKCINLMVHKG